MPVQHLYPQELSCDRVRDIRDTQLNPEVTVFRPRNAAAAAQSVAEDEEEFSRFLQ